MKRLWERVDVVKKKKKQLSYEHPRSNTTRNSQGGLAWNCLRALAIAVGVGLRTIVGGMSFWQVERRREETRWRVRARESR
jgi:hypothetical protein